uniref:Uncharacterized protein n=1 Tax=Junco hyemalis TaxID=40217 RepID=A0A8C5IPN9_JUNHY
QHWQCQLLQEGSTDTSAREIGLAQEGLELPREGWNRPGNVWECLGLPKVAGNGWECPRQWNSGLWGHSTAQHSHVAVDLLGLAVAPQQPPQDPHAPHPGDLLGHAGVGLPHCHAHGALTDAHVPALPAGQRVLPAAGARVHGHGLADDQPILDQLADLLPCKGTGTSWGLPGSTLEFHPSGLP